MLKLRTLAAAALAVAAFPVLAQAAPAFSTANVNLRSGPSTGYPSVQVIPAGSRIEIFGCMQGANWCDVSYRGMRGWMSGSYLQATYSQRRVYVDQQYYRPLGIPTVTFSVGTYWDRHYKSRDFYRERDRWRDYDRGGDRGGWRDNDRRDNDRRDSNRGDWRDDRRDNDWPREVRGEDNRPPRFDDRSPRDPNDMRDPRNQRGPDCAPGQRWDRGECR